MDVLYLRWVKDTVYDASALDVALLAEVQLDELPEATGVVVVHGFGVSKGLHDRTEQKKTDTGFSSVLVHFQCSFGLVLVRL